MRSVLTGDHAKMVSRKLGEIQRQLGQDHYPYDLERLLVALQAIIEGRFDAVGGHFPSITLAADLIKEGWKVVDDVVWSDFNIRNLAPLALIFHQERSVSGEEMRRRAVQYHCDLGLVDLKRMLTEQEKIPTEFRNFETVFPGTILMDSEGVRRVPCLKFVSRHWNPSQGVWREGYWDIRWAAIREEWGARQRFAGREE